MGGLLVGQETGPFHDPDADAELVDQGGENGVAGRGRVPQVRYTFAGPYGTSAWVAASQPAADFATTFGTVNNDTNYTAGAVCPAGSLAATNNATILCGSSSAFFNAAQNLMPDWTITGRIGQPWGHVQAATAFREITLNDGQYLNKSWFGYGGTISGDVHPFFDQPGSLAKDDLGGGFATGSAEYAYGHRVVASGLRGDCYTIEGTMRVRF